MVRAATLVALLSASCVSTSSNVCEDGSTCPGGFECDVANHRCLLPEQVALCAGLDEDADCAFDGAPGKCRVGACIPYFCGDGYVSNEVGEDCEPTQDPATYAKDCKTYGFYQAEGIACSASCTFDLGLKATEATDASGCYANEYCGDTTINGPELCEPPDNRTCVSIGFDAGSTTCNEQCGFSINDCSRFGWNPESLSTLQAFAVAGSARDDQWAVGEGGTIMRYEGAFWNPVPSGVTNELVAAWSTTRTDAWVVGTSGANPAVLLHWDGTVWSSVTGVPTGDYFDVWGASATAVYVASSIGVLAYDGATWAPMAGFTGTPRTIRGASTSDIWVSTTGGPLMHYDGAQWTDRSPSGASIEFLDVNAPTDVWAIGYATGNEGTGIIAHYNGATWQQWLSPGKQFGSVASSAPNDTWVAGADGLMRHWDGVAWSSSTSIGASPSGLAALSGLISIGAGEVVAVSTLNLAYRYRGQTFGTIASLGSNPFDATDNKAIWRTGADNVYVGNAKGEIWHFDGDSWSLSFTTPANAPVNDLWGTSATDIWAVATDGSAYHFTGEMWITVPLANGITLVRVWSEPSGNVFAFTLGGVNRFDGESWSYTELGAGTVVSVSGSGPDNVWAVQRGPSAVWKFDGSTWTQMQTGLVVDPLAVAALAPNNVHITSTNGRFLHFDNVTWTESQLNVLANIDQLAFTAPDNIYGASERDLVHFDGAAWSTIRPPVDFFPNSSDYLPIVGLHASPGRLDIMLRRYRFRTLMLTRPLICRPDETCDDGVDNDCDDVIDALDSDCP